MMMIRCTFLSVVILLSGLNISDARAQEITVDQIVACRNVVDRMPVDAGDKMPAGIERVFCFTWIKGALDETEITHNWYYQGVLKASVTLPVRSANWRTWSSKALLPEWTGEWMVEILSKEGTPLENLIFTVE